jgi:hypothetical protein
MIDGKSPLRFLDIDVSQHIYETYFPSPLLKGRFNQVIDQLDYHIENYEKEPHFSNTEPSYITCYYHRPTYRLADIVEVSVFLQYIKQQLNFKNLI